MKSKKPFAIEHAGRNVHVVRFNISGPEWSQRVLVASDQHWDNPDCNRDMMHRHYKEAVECGAPILGVGDFFCAMQGKFDRRSDKSKIRPEHQCGDYLDSLVKTAADDLEPYASNLVMLGVGNHESSIKRHHETDLAERLAQTLRDRTGTSVQAGGYGGFVRFMFLRGRQSQSIRASYFHGSGGGGPVTKGTIQTNRRQEMIDADIYLTGHVHESWALERGRCYLNDANNVVHQHGLHICIPGYKDEFKDGHGGFHVECGRGAKPTGAYWIEFDFRASKVHYRAIKAD